jgi:hypothetical protein
VFSGSATLKGPAGSIRVVAQAAQACAASSSADEVSFSGRASVVGGTGPFVGAHGTVSFNGSYARSTGAVTVSARGRIVY